MYLPLCLAFAAVSAVVDVNATPAATITTTPYPTPATTCGNQGLEWAYYTNTVTNTLYFTPQPYKTVAPIATGTLSSPGGFRVENAVSTFSPYGSTRSLASKRFVLQHRGWLYAPVTGTYAFTITNPNDSIYLWVGSDQTGGAYTGWTNFNTLIAGHPDSRPATYINYMQLNAGNYVPIRIMLVQWAGGAGYGIQIVAPGGITLAESGKTSKYLVRFDCGGEGLAPRFVPWGQEY